ncbi:hypothetical protein D9M68_600490 [compost metagenome]
MPRITATIPAICCERVSSPPTASATVPMVASMRVISLNVELISADIFAVSSCVPRASCSTSSACSDTSVTDCANAVMPQTISSVAACCVLALLATPRAASPSSLDTFISSSLLWRIDPTRPPRCLMKRLNAVANFPVSSALRRSK